MTESEPTQFASYMLRLRWPDGQPATQPANQFAISMGLPVGGSPDAIYLSIGHAAPPVITAAVDLSEGGPHDLGVVDVNIFGRYMLTRGRLDELIGLLQNAATQYDEAQGGDSDVDGES
ncbi:hypothetical protein ACFW1A_09990 [Kitasatospora sp. NPDC058965]|uniref:hypothetical protein n=1 Tax=Kitasatospora sp. NPDC058965 TaxID=3346682 RepID=UPI0036D18333